MDKKKTLYRKLKDYFHKNLKLSFVGIKNFIIVTKEDKVYEFEKKSVLSSEEGLHHYIVYKNLEMISLNSNQLLIESFINNSIVDELCYKQIVDLKTSNFHTIALTSNGCIYCWGINHRGALGNGIAEDFKIYKPELNKYLSQTHVIDVSCGFGHSLILTSDGDVYAFGCNENGQIGTGDTKDMLIPFHVNGFNEEKIKAISCGGRHSMALTKNGQVYFWGNYGSKESDSEALIGRTLLSSFRSPKLIEIDVIFNKLECGVMSDLLLPVEGDLYSVFINFNREQHELLKFIISDKFTDIAKMVTPDVRQEISAAVSENEFFYVWGYIDGEYILEPKKSEFESFNDIFGHYLQVTYVMQGSIPQYIDDFIKDKKYKKINDFKTFEQNRDVIYQKLYKNKIDAMKKVEPENTYSKESFKELLCDESLSQILKEISENQNSINGSEILTCECGAQIEKNCFEDHTYNCLALLRKFDLILKEQVNMLKTEYNEKRDKISILSQLENVDEFNILETNMSDIMKKRLLDILRISLKERFSNTSKLCERFSLEFGGIWNIIITTEFFFNQINCYNFISLKIDKFVAYIYSNIKSINHVLIIDKQIEVLRDGIENRSWNDDLVNTWRFLHNLSDDSLNMCEKLLDKNITKYFIDYIDLVAHDDENYWLSSIGVLANISEFTELRDRLMKEELITAIILFASNPKFIISFLSSYILANILSEGNLFWDQFFKENEVLRRNSVINILNCQITTLESESITFGQLTFNSLKPFYRLLKLNDKIPKQVFYFALWSLNRLLKSNERYISLSIEEDGFNILRNLSDKLPSYDS